MDPPDDQSDETVWSTNWNDPAGHVPAVAGSGLKCQGRTSMKGADQGEHPLAASWLTAGAIPGAQLRALESRYSQRSLGRLIPQPRDILEPAAPQPAGDSSCPP